MIFSADTPEEMLAEIVRWLEKRQAEFAASFSDAKTTREGREWKVRWELTVSLCTDLKLATIAPKESTALKRLIEEVRVHKGALKDSGYNRTHNRHNR